MEFENEIVLGDANELIKRIPDKSVDLIVTDPPYKFNGSIGSSGIFNYRDFSYADQLNKKSGIISGFDLSILNEFVRVMKKVNCYIWCNKEQIFDYLQFFVKERGCNFEIIIWAKGNPPPFTCGHFLKDKEYCLYFWEKGVKNDWSLGKENYKTVFFTDNPNISDKKLYGHPTIKPRELIDRLIRISSREGGVILDPFSGSGTTCVSAKSLGRKFIGFEIDEDYWKASVDRLNGITKKEADSGYVQQKLF